MTRVSHHENQKIQEGYFAAPPPLMDPMESLSACKSRASLAGSLCRIKDIRAGSLRGEKDEIFLSI